MTYSKITSIRRLILLTSILFFALTATAQYTADDVNRYANWGDPEYQRNISIWRNYQIAASKNPMDLEAMRNAENQMDLDWINSGLSTIWVPNQEAKKQVVQLIVAEIKKLKAEKLPNETAYRELPRSASDNYRGQYLAGFDQNVKISRLKKLEPLIRIGKDKGTPVPKPDNNNLEQEFLHEIYKINADIERINSYARGRELELSLITAQQLCDKIRLLQGRQYFSSTLKEIRKKNPGFSFTINPLANQVTRDYWIRMRNRANLSYRSAMEAHSGCVYNEGIQQWGYVEIPLGFAKATFDLVTNWKDMLNGKLFGTFSSLSENAGKGANAVRTMEVVGEDIIKAGNEAADWKSYAGIVGGFISAFDGYVKTYNIAVENYQQGDLLKMNRESAQQLIQSNRLLLQEFDRYRAFIESKSSAIDCLNDKLMRIDLDNKSIKGDKISIWGTGNYDWDGEEYINQIKEAGEDLKNEYIYCEDFVKTLQIAVSQANNEYYALEDKIRNSGADQSQINAQISYNQENGLWFEQESTRLSEYYVQFCEGNTVPDDVIVVSTQVVPGVEEQNGDPDAPPVWDYETTPYDPDDQVPSEESIPPNTESSSHGGGETIGIISTGNGWSAQRTTANEYDLRRDIGSAVNSGRTPAGLYVESSGEMLIYYINENPLGMTAWNLEWYTDAETLQNGINNNMEEGYFPMGISFTEEGQLYVLYILSDLRATAWQLVESELELGAVAHNMQVYIDDSYIPVGITVFAGKYYTLMAQVPDAQMTNWTIEGYEDNLHSIQQNINAKANAGMIPFGYLKEEHVVNVLFVGF